MAAAKRRGLGSRDLDVLLGGGDEPALSGGEELRNLPLKQIQSGKYQPRQTFDDDRLAELAASIKAQGVIQPIVVRLIGPARYEIIAGERRWRAAQRVGLSEIPALVRQVADAAVAAMTLIENIQREELAPLEEAQALRRLISEFQHTHQQVADAIGRSRASVTNLLRLLDLPDEIKRLLEQHKLEMGHARALAALDEQRALGLAWRAVAHGWSVRELEDAARREPSATSSAPKKTATRDANIVALERDLSEKLAARVSIQHGRGGRGKLVIRYHSLDELDGILERIH